MTPDQHTALLHELHAIRDTTSEDCSSNFRRIEAILDSIAREQPTDPDAHITDTDAYLQDKRERAKDTDFDAIEVEGATPQPAKVLTDAAIKQAAHDRYLKLFRNGDEEWQRRLADAMEDGMRYARDSGYLAPAPPVDIERIMEVVTKAYTDGLSGMRGGMDLYRTRLINALTQQ